MGVANNVQLMLNLAMEILFYNVNKDFT